MKRLSFLALLLAAGSAWGQAATQAPPVREAVTEGQPPGREVMYACPGGTDFAAVFSEEGELATLTVPGQPDIELSRQRSGSGFAYGDSYYELRGRGREATLTAAGRSMRCHAVGRPGEPPRTYEGGKLTITLFPDGVFRLRERRDAGEPKVDIGQWMQEVDGGVRMVLRGAAGQRRVFREANGDRLVAADGTELARAATPDMIDDQFELGGLYRDTPSGGMFAECLSGRTYTIAPGGAEPELEKAWTEATPSREASVFIRLQGKFRDGDLHAERFLALDANATCPALPARSSALRDTEWRVVEIDGDRPKFANRRQQPSLRLDNQGKFTASTGCNTVAGTYQLDPEGLRFVTEAAPQAQCPAAVSAIERRYLDALAAVRQAQISSTVLDLMDQTNKRRLRLESRGR
ncbi:MAG: META domain-containing protein [Reyranella sp.]|uniref:META domain-containing protein n=1 Tax=Reyranella sp. TaxID=1929291 RepID=UPI003D0A48AA